MDLRPVGYVSSPVLEETDAGWREVVSKIIVQEELAAGLQGLDEFSHAVIVFWMHRSSFDLDADLLRRPQGREDMPELGIFAQRAKHRPNPLGVTSAEIVAVEGNVLVVRGLDAIDGTPVLDIKPYFPAFDRIANPVTPAWVELLMEGYF